VSKTKEQEGVGVGKSSLKFGHWRRKEQAKYKAFLRKYYFIMKDSMLRYHYRIFTKMAEEIGTRNAIQCKSHHQKMLTKANNSIESLIFTPDSIDHPVIVEGLPQANNHSAILEGVSKVETTSDIPWFMVETSGRIVVVIDDRFMNSF
jgi:hypothetical protein